MMARPLRKYQQDAVEKIAAARGKGRNVLYVAPTGTGKTIVFAHDLKRVVDAGGRALVIAHRKELLDQTARELVSLGVRAEVEQGQRRAEADAQVVVAAVQTLGPKRRARFARDAFEVLVIDEAHHAAAKSYRAVVEYFAAAHLVGVTATPDRLDRKKLDMFEEVVEYSVDDAMERGWLAKVRPLSVYIEGLDLSLVRSHGGAHGLNEKELAKVIEANTVLKDVVTPLLEQVGSRRTLIFAVTVKHAQELAGLLNKRVWGVAAAVWGGDPERDGKLRAFAAGRVQILVNCELLTEGYDDPGIGCVAMVRPTKSRAKYAQMLGRGWRPAPGKDHLLVLDFCGNHGRHSLASPGDVLAPNELPEVVKAALAELERDPGMTFDRALEIAKGLPEQEMVKYRVEESAPPTCEECGAVVSVRKARRCRSCAGMRHRPDIDWPAVFAEHGDKSDREIAKPLGVAARTVGYHRKRLGLPPVEPPRHRPDIDWPAVFAEHGDKGNGEIAKPLGVAARTVGRHRKRLGLPPAVPWRRRPDIDWPAVFAEHGDKSDREIAKPLGVSADTVGYHRRKHQP